MPEISVIMGVYNELNKDILMEAVNSILHQTFEDFEFIIYDDGSCPEAATLLREVAGLDERIKLIGQDENHGLAFSLNACIDEAKGKYIARMDADDISYSERLMKQKKFLDKYQEYSWVGCNIDVFDQNGVWGERKMPEFPIEQDYLRFSPYAHPTVMYRCNLLEYLTQRDIQTKNSGVNVRYRGKHRFFKGFNEFIKEKTRRCDNDFEKIERHVFF